MMKLNADTGCYEFFEEQDTEQNTAELPSIENETGQYDSVKKLAEGLSTATTIAQIRSVAKQILDETGGDSE